MALGCVALDVKHTALRPKIVEEAHALGLAVLRVDGQRAARVRDCSREWGVDTIITDAVDRLRPG